MFKNSIIGKSKQTWKLGIGFAILVFGFSTMVFGLNCLEEPGGVEMVMAGVGIGLGSFITMCFSIRCPDCGIKWFWVAVSTQKSLQYLNWLASQNVCPNCGRDPKEYV